MNMTSKFTQPTKTSEPPETHKEEWVPALLRRVARTEAGRIGMLATLAAADLWRIWYGTAHGAEPRDRRTHATAAEELMRRGLLDRAGQPCGQAAASATARNIR
jgi:hypothetical protein